MCQKVFHVARNRVASITCKNTHTNDFILVSHTLSPRATTTQRHVLDNQVDGVKNLESVSFITARMCCKHLLGTYHKGCLKGLRKCARPVVTDLVAFQTKFGDRPVRLVMFPVTAVQPRRPFLYTIAKRPTAQNNVMLHCVL